MIKTRKQRLQRVLSFEKLSKAASKYFNRFRVNIKSLRDCEVANIMIRSDRSFMFRSKRGTRIWYKAVSKFEKFKEELLEESFVTQQTIINSTQVSNYRYKARFVIAATNIYHIKGYELLLEYGRYHPDCNPTGVVKDHRISVKYGEENGICPSIIGHICNCEYLKMQDNVSKSDKCSLTLNDLLQKIDRFNKKQHLT